MPRLAFVRRLLAAVLVAAAAAPALAQDKITFLTSWYAQAEHGGFYQAIATGLYKKHGLDVTIKMGGPQVNGMQLLMAGQADVIMGYDFQALKAIEQGMPVVTVATSFQRDLQGMLTHEDVASLAGLKGKADPRGDLGPLDLVALAQGEVRLHRGADQALHLQPAAVLRRQDARAAGLSVVRAVPGGEGGHQGRSSILFADDGYPPYGTTMVATQKLAKEQARCRRAVRARVARRLEELSRRSRGPANDADQEGQPEHEGRPARLRGREAEGIPARRPAATRRRWASA